MPRTSDADLCRPSLESDCDFCNGSFIAAVTLPWLAIIMQRYPSYLCWYGCDVEWKGVRYKHAWMVHKTEHGSANSDDESAFSEIAGHISQMSKAMGARNSHVISCVGHSTHQHIHILAM